MFLAVDHHDLVAMVDGARRLAAAEEADLCCPDRDGCPTHGERLLGGWPTWYLRQLHAGWPGPHGWLFDRVRGGSADAVGTDYAWWRERGYCCPWSYGGGCPTTLAEGDLVSSTDVDLPPGYYLDVWNDTGAWCSLPWPDLAVLPPSLGPQVIAWAEWRTYELTGEPGLVHHLTGEQWRYTPGQRRFLHLWYAYSATGRWLYRRGVKRGAKGVGKDPFGASLCNAELIGPTRLVFRDGRWVGERHRMPLVQIASNSEAQSKDVLRVANAMLPRETREYYSVDCGETRTIVTGVGGRLEVLTASEASSEGDPATFILLNESHHMTESSGGHRVAAVARRNVGKSPAQLQARLCEMTNAHQQGSDSVGERSFEAWQKQVSGRARRQDILYDSIEAPPSTDLVDDASRMAGLRAAYMDAPWADFERLDGEVLDPDTSVADSIRYYFNGLAAAEDAWIDPRKFDDLARADVVVADREQIALFLDCSRARTRPAWSPAASRMGT